MLWRFAGLDWLLSHGGNLLLAPAELLDAHPGLLDRAAEVEEYVEAVSAGEGFALALGGEPLATAVHVTPDALFLLRWMRGDVAAVRATSAVCTELTYEPDGGTLPVGEAGLVLLDSGASGPGVTRLPLTVVPPGQYAVASCHYLPDDLAYLIVHRLVCVGGGGLWFGSGRRHVPECRQG